MDIFSNFSPFTSELVYLPILSPSSLRFLFIPLWLINLSKSAPLAKIIFFSSSICRYCKILLSTVSPKTSPFTGGDSRIISGILISGGVILFTGVSSGKAAPAPPPDEPPPPPDDPPPPLLPPPQDPPPEDPPPPPPDCSGST